MQTNIMIPQRQQRRVLRSPKHQWYLKHRPWELQPFLIAPVLPGETMKNFNLQARVVTDPIANPIMGWWCEHFMFYVKLRDLYARDKLTDMILKPETDVSTLDGATDTNYYHQNGTETAINWPKLCMEVITESYFRNEGELAGTYVNGTLYLTSVNTENFLNSAANNDVIETASGVDQNLVSVVAGQGDATANVYTSEIDKAMREYEFARSMKLTEVTFEEYCEQYGVKLPQQEFVKPELIRYSRDWTYPTNTVDPTNGTPRSAASWSVQLRADKDRLFREMGFIVGVTVVRPKIYFQNLNSHATMLMKNAYAWLPPQLAADPMASFLKVTAGDPPLDANTKAYYVDIKDLFMYGDQFTNVNLATETGMNKVALPNAALSNRRYPASTDMDNLFVDTTAGVGKVKQDGICQFHILGRQVETSPMMVGTNKTI